MRQAGEWDVQEVEHEAGMCGGTSGESAIVREDWDEAQYKQGHEVRMSVRESIGAKFRNMVMSLLLIWRWVVVVQHDYNTGEKCRRGWEGRKMIRIIMQSKLYISKLYM